MRYRLLASAAAFGASVLMNPAAAAQPQAPAHLRCEYLIDPVAIDELAPRFTWEVNDSSRGARQGAYEIRVASTPEAAAGDRPDVWSSGKVASAHSVNVEYGGPALQSGRRYHWAVRTWDQAGAASPWSEAATFGVGLLEPTGWGGARWIGDPTPAPPIVPAAPAEGGQKPRPAQGLDALPAPMLRKEFEITGPARRATLYIAAVGLYEASINGQRVGDHELAPEWTDYTLRVQYQGYDVTPLLRPGANAIGVMLGDGWYAGRLGMAQQFSEHKWPRAVYGRQPRLLALLLIETQDGKAQRIVTDESWRSTLDGPVRKADFLDGEENDARRWVPGWDQPGFVEASGGAVWAAAQVDTSARPLLVAQPNEPIRVLQEVKPVALSQPAPGAWVFHLGQNMAGRCRLRVKGAAGATVTLHHAEAVNDDGTIYTANLRGAPQADRCILAGDASGEVFEPRFTYHGFRYVEIKGDIAPPTIDDLRGVVLGSSSAVVGSFECSNP